MMNGKIMGTMENSDTKSILRIISHNVMARLIVFNLIIFIYMLYDESRTFYEPWFEPLPSELTYLKPMLPERYNTIIVVFVINAIVLYVKLKRKLKENEIRIEFVCATIYMAIIDILISIGYAYLALTTHSMIVSGNMLFVIPNKLFGEDTIENIGLENQLYIVLSIIAISLTLCYQIKLLKYMLKNISCSSSNYEK